MTISFELDGRLVETSDDGSTLLTVLRQRFGIRSVKDGCSPQGQCGCCTVLVDGRPRVSCVTPVRRVKGRSVLTLGGLPESDRDAWADAFVAVGASQCGFCTPGIVMRLHALCEQRAGTDPDGQRENVDGTLVAHLCRCTGWQTIREAYSLRVSQPEGTEGRIVEAQNRDLDAAAKRATIEGRTAQVVGPPVVLGAGGFADDEAPEDALVAVPDGRGGWAMGESLTEARAAVTRPPSRRGTMGTVHPVELPDGDWYRTLRTTWVEPAYLETDASWCEPGGEPASALGNGGAFGAKRSSPAASVARRLADEHQRPVRVLLSREDTVRMGPKRPPLAIGVDRRGRGACRVARTPGIGAAIAGAGLDLEVEEIDLPGPATATDLRGAGWAEAVVVLASLDDDPDEVRHPEGGRARAIVDDDAVHVWVSCGRPLDVPVLRSYCIGAVHMAIGWVTSESLAVDELGAVHDLTIRSFGILRAADTPTIDVEIEESDDEPVNGSDAVFAAVAAAMWRRRGFPQCWPTDR